tara:strand:- start:373 stop:996 length:624 start_codon:yes stop_codon:yes gene_type:complete
MALDKNFLKYKLEKIKNDRIFKDQDTETKKRIRKENAKYSAEEADAIHSYLTGEDNIDALDNKSYLENRLPGSLFLIPRRKSRGNKTEWQGELNIRTAQSDPKIKKNRLSRILKRFQTVAKSNVDSAKQLVIFRKIFDSLNIFFSKDEIKVDGIINSKGYKIQEGKEEYEGITEDFIVADMETAGTIIRKRIIVKNGLIVGQEIINQ